MHINSLNDKHISLALYMPEIPQNTGALIRTCASLNASLHIIHPCGFIWSDKFLVRSHMDYIHNANIIHHKTYTDFVDFAATGKHRIIATVCHEGAYHHSFTYMQGDIILCGQESIGLPKAISEQCVKITILTQSNTRSLNLAIAGSIILSHSIFS